MEIKTFKRMITGSSDSIMEEIERLKDEVAIGDCGFSVKKDFAIGYFGYDMFNELTGERDEDDPSEELVEWILSEALKEVPSMEPVGSVEYTYDPEDENVEYNVVFVIFQKKVKK